MPKIKKGLTWFQVLLMNIGLGMGTIGQIQLIVSYSPIIEHGILPIILSLIYIFFYVLLVIGVLGMDILIYQKGIKVLTDARSKS